MQKERFLRHKKLSLFFKAAFFACLASSVFYSCDTFSGEDDFKQKLTGAYFSTYTFYDKNPEAPDARSVSVEYRIGSKQNFNDQTLDAFKDSAGGASFIGWDYVVPSGASEPKNLTYNADGYINGATVTPQEASFIAVYGVEYTVKHMQQNIDLVNYAIEKTTETKHGVAGTPTNAAPLQYKGFTAKSVTQVPIAADGSTVVTIQYDRNSYTLSFDANDGTGTMDPQTLYYEVPTAIRTAEFTRQGYSFAGWATSSGGSVEYADGATYTIDAGNATLYAVWSEPVLYVSNTGNDSNTGFSESEPLKTLSKALDVIAQTDGGLSGANQRDWTVYIIGEVVGNVSLTSANSKFKTLTITGKTGSETDTLKGDGTGSVIAIDSIGVTVNIKNLKITGGSANEGGAINNNNMTLNIENCIITQNTATGFGACGGGIYSSAGTVNIKSSTISGNTVTSSNMAYGGGICTESTGPLSIENSTISGNTVTSSDKAWGGGIYTNSLLSIENSTISENKAENTAGGTASCGGGVYVGNAGSLKITGGTIKNNSASYGGGIHSVGTVSLEPDVSDPLTFTDNIASTSGGAICNNTMLNINIKGNVNFNSPSKNINDVYLGRTGDGFYKIKITGALTGSAILITPGTYTEGKEVLVADSTGLIASNYTKFTVTPNESEQWLVNSDGKLAKNNTSGSGGTFTVPDNSVNISVDNTVAHSASDTKFTFTIKDTTDGTPTNITATVTDVTLKVYAAGIDVTDTSLFFTTTETERSITVKSGIPKGTVLTLYISVKYKDQVFSASFNVGVVD